MTKLRLIIKDYEPKILLVTDSRKKDIGENIGNLSILAEKIIEKLGIKLESTDQDSRFFETLSIARESDEHFIWLTEEQANSINLEKSLWENIESFLSEAISNTYVKSELIDAASEEVRSEIQKYVKYDILASSLYIAYEILFEKILKIMTDLQIDNFELEDHHQNNQMIELLAKKFSECGLCLNILKIS